MGHGTVLVIGEDFRDQLDKFQRAAYADRHSRHFVNVDILAKARGEHSRHASSNDRFPDWAMSMYAIKPLEPGALPELLGMHWQGWMRLNAEGEVSELIERTIPGGFHDWYEKPCYNLLLKPGARAIPHEPEGDDKDFIVSGFAACARKGDIDFNTMVKALQEEADKRWSTVMAARGAKTWETFDTILRRVGAAGMEDARRAASEAWQNQPAVQAIRGSLASMNNCMAPDMDVPHLEFLVQHTPRNIARWNGIDAYHVSREEFMQRYTLRRMMGYTETIRHGALLSDAELEPLLDDISDDTLVTLAQVHC